MEKGRAVVGDSGAVVDMRGIGRPPGVYGRRSGELRSKAEILSPTPEPGVEAAVVGNEDTEVPSLRFRCEYKEKSGLEAEIGMGVVGAGEEGAEDD